MAIEDHVSLDLGNGPIELLQPSIYFNAAVFTNPEDSVDDTQLWVWVAPGRRLR
jgi:hypothetical protein